ncbi:MAG: NepR family anti-sigma factor [Pseudomonadota bacterium]
MAQKPTKSSVDRQINENLQRVYDDDANDELPQRFFDLIAELKQKSEGESTDDS